MRAFACIASSPSTVKIESVRHAYGGDVRAYKCYPNITAFVGPTCVELPQQVKLFSGYGRHFKALELSQGLDQLSQDPEG